MIAISESQRSLLRQCSIALASGVIFFMIYYGLFRLVGNWISMIVMVLLSLTIFLLYLWRQRAPQQRFIDFLEDYADGKSVGKTDGVAGSSTPVRFGLPQQKSARTGGLSLSLVSVVPGKVKQWLLQRKTLNENGVVSRPETVQEIAIPGPIFLGLLEKLPSQSDFRSLYAGIQEGKYQTSIDTLKRLSTRFPGKNWLQNDLALLYFLNNRFDEALLAWERLGSSLDQSPWMQFNLGLFFIRLKKYQKAFACLEKSLQIQENAAAHYHLAALYARTGNRAKVVDHLAQAKALGVNYQRTILSDPAFLGYRSEAEKIVDS